jgi:LmbE family N-acetylglucosaminyl deacetylase
MGATIARLVEEKCEFRWLILSNATISLPDGFDSDTLINEQLAAAEVLGIPRENLTFRDYPVRNFDKHRQDILEELVCFKKDFMPDHVFCPSSNDIHQDHFTVHRETVRAFKNTNLFGYDLPWNYTEQNMNYSFRISHEHAEKKIKALSCYKSQEHRKYMDVDLIKSILKFRALNTAYDLCETFECVRGYYD